MGGRRRPAMGAQLSKQLAGVAARDLGVQLACAAVAIPMQTELFYDFSGSCTYIYLILQSLLSNSNKPSLRALANSSMALVWATRLGSFLLQRILKDGRDSRFDKVRTKPGLFLSYWVLQAVWIFFTALPVYILNCKQRKSASLEHKDQAESLFTLADVNADGVLSKSEIKKYCLKEPEFTEMFQVQDLGWASMWSLLDQNNDGKFSKDEWVAAYVATRSHQNNDGNRVSTRDKIGWTMWGVGFLMQVIADRQKSAFRALDGSRGKWIKEGLWGLAQHPNYGGEIMMWSGIFTSCSSEFKGLEMGSIASPMFVAYLLIKVSGVPLLRKANMRKWGNDPAYLKYLAETPMLIPFTRFLGL